MQTFIGWWEQINLSNNLQTWVAFKNPKTGLVNDRKCVKHLQRFGKRSLNIWSQDWQDGFWSLQINAHIQPNAVKVMKCCFFYLMTHHGHEQQWVTWSQPHGAAFHLRQHWGQNDPRTNNQTSVSHCFLIKLINTFPIIVIVILSLGVMCHELLVLSVSWGLQPYNPHFYPSHVFLTFQA